MAKQPTPNKPTETWPQPKSSRPSAVQPKRFVLRLKNDEGQEVTLDEFVAQNPGLRPATPEEKQRYLASRAKQK